MGSTLPGGKNGPPSCDAAWDKGYAAGLAEGAREEREACAKVADRFALDEDVVPNHDHDTGADIAAAIRARKEPA